MQSTLGTALPYVVAVAIGVLFLWMLWLASKDKLIGALLAGALCTMCLGFYPALQWWGFGETIAETVQGAEGVEAVAASPVKQPISVALWLVLFAVPGPFLAVASQVFFKLIKRVRAAQSE